MESLQREGPAMKIGIIGGTGLDDPKLLQDCQEKEVMTKFGEPSSKLTLGKINGVDVVILARHGKEHNISPTKVNYRANIQALKDEGCTHLIVSTACGSLKENIKPGDFVFIDQFIDRTTKREQTLFDERVNHVPMAEPFCSNLRRLFSEAAKKLKLPYHEKGTIVTIEGPRFSTKSESNMFRQMNADVINMTTVPEVVLAREAKMCYAAIAMSTDYDCWKEGEAHVTFEKILEIINKNAESVKKLFLEVISKINDEECECRQ